MFRKGLKVFLISLITSVSLGAILGAIFGFASIKHDKTLIFGNFGEYESPELQTQISNEISNQYHGVSVQYTYYNLNNQLPAMYENNQLSIGVPTDYEAAELISLGLIKPLDYAIFNTNGMKLGYYLNKQYVPIENGILPIQVNLAQENKQFNVPYTLNGIKGINYSMQEAYKTEYKYSICNLLSPNVICDITQIYLHCDFNNIKHIDIFNYDLPYFFQNYIFAYSTYGYKQSSNNQYNLSNLSSSQSWKQIMSDIQNNNWFHSYLNKPKVGMVTSPQSVYSVAASIEYDNDNEVPITNPIDTNSSIKSMTNTFSYFTRYLSKKYLGSNPIYRSQSSAGIINELDNGQIHGGFCYNGDALYTAMGGNYGNSLTNKQWDALMPNTFHVVHPKYTMIALDTVGINRSLPNNLLYIAYKFLYDLCLNGADANPSFDGYNEQFAINANHDNVNYTNSYEYLLTNFQNNNQLINLIKGQNENISCPFYYWSKATNINNNNDPWKNYSTQVQNEQNFIGSINNNGIYKYGIMQNFSYNLYVSPFLNINNFASEIITKLGANLTQGTAGMNWFTTQTSYPFPSNTSLTTYNQFNNWFENIYTINPSNYIYTIPNNINFTITPNTCVELPLTKIQISNQAIAFNDVMYQDFSN